MNSFSFFFSILSLFFLSSFSLLSLLKIYYGFSMTNIMPRLYIGGISVASDRNWLYSHGITHIVNCALELPNYFPNEFYYLKLDMEDSLKEEILRKMDIAYSFINDALLNPKHAVLIHCYMGMSRSASTLIYYIMRKYHIPLAVVLNKVKAMHPITNPNENFINQLKFINSKMGYN